MLTVVKGIRTNAIDKFGNIYIQMSTDHFLDWLQNELKERSWNQSHFARMTGLTTAGISKLLSGNRGAGPDACKAIARALDLSEEFVFRKAGLLAPQSGYDVTYEEWRAILNELNEENRQELLHIARLRLERQRDQQFSERFKSLPEEAQAEAWALIEELIERKGWKFKD